MTASAKGPTRQQLRDEARRLGIPHSGTRAELEARIKAAKENGSGEDAIADQPAGEEVAIDGVVVRIQRNEDGGVTIGEFLPVGDVRPTEITWLLEKAASIARERSGLPPVGG